MIPTPRPPSPVIVADANIVIGAVLGRSGPLLARLGTLRILATTDRARIEVMTILRNRPGLPASLLPRARALFAGLHVVPPAAYGAHIDRAAIVLGAPDHRDAHLLALAWVLDGDLWSHDRDFFGTGWPVWTSGNLKLALDA